METESLLNLEEVNREILRALNLKNSFSLVRLGHAEMYAISYSTWPQDIWDFSQYESYCGITDLGDKVTKQILQALKSADVVGIGDHTPPWQKQMGKIFEHYHIQLEKTTSAWVTHQMIKSPGFKELLAKRKIVVIGRRGEEGAAKLKEMGMEIAGVASLEGFSEIETVLTYLKKKQDFEIALVAAGVPATIICPQIAKETGKVAIDFGHALDLLIDGEEGFDFEKLTEDFNLSNGIIDPLKGGINDEA